ncbi:DUF6701 domain-containing protein [Alkalimonas amylolytica]|uniref:Concanavalin A-like lectin/glucanases superfamily protein n=1 Tax=Alkalimonas amylolytica TaxID=152573 RepID=A0A1H4FTB3_ALKAM|nr:DUF6701 domain-containing protein [Alkalimonas amylolytica]SEB00556.1 Concanavalin A-like lectin/glucanases superfamily protein [Alkalimonas amylolytica]
MQRLLNLCCVFLCLLFASSLWAQPNCQELYASPSGINPNLGANGISPFDLANVPWQTTPWPASGTTLNSGNYYFGTLNTNNFYQLSIASGARVTIFVNDNLVTNNFLRLNASGNPEQLTIVVRSNVSINNLAEINGLIYAAGSININNNDVIVGGLAATGSISVGTNTVVTRDDTAIAQLELPGLCTASPVTVPDPRALYPLDLCSTLNNSVVEDLMQQYPATGYQLTPADGKVLAGANFSSTGMSRVELPSGLLNGLTDFSVSLWFKADASNSFRQILSASNNSQDTVLELYVRNNNVLRAGLLGVYYAFGSPEPVLNNNSWYHATLTRSGNQLCLYLDANLVQCQTASAAALSVTRAALGVWWQANGTMSDPFRGDLDEVLFFSSALSVSQIQTIYNNQNDGRNYDGAVREDTCLGCFSDNFSSSVLSDDWVTSRSSGSFTPSIVNGRLRMTQAVGNQSTAATYQRLFPAADNLVVIEFDYLAYGGSGADGLAVVLSDANVTPQPGSFGGPLGYGSRANQNIPGFAGGWLGIGLDEFGNFSTEGGPGGPGRRQQSVAVRGSGSGTSGYRYLRGTCNNGATNPAGGCLNPRVDGNQANPHRYRITVDSRAAGRAWVSVERDHGTGFISLIAPFDVLAQPGQASVPENFLLSLTGSTGGSTNIHELDNVSICALRSLPVGVQIDHFEFDHSGQALTCQPETLTMRACLNADCSQLYTDPVTATLSPQPVPGGEWLGGHVINFSGGSTTVQLRRSTVGAVTVGVTGSVPGTRPLSTTLCRAGSGPKNTTSCTLNFANSGFVLEVPDGIANQPATDVRLRAVRESDPGQACVPAFANVSRSVQFWSGYITPDAAGRPVSMPVQVNGQAISLSNATPSTRSLTFDANGEALLSVNYADAGRVQLNARYQGANVTGDAGLVLQGATQFSKRPYGLCVQTAANCAAGNASCPAFVRAGEAFNVELSAHAWQDGGAAICDMPVTPNFTLAGISLEHELLTPAQAEGAVPGQLQPMTYQHQRAVTGTTVVDALLSEVGVFRITARPSPLTYLGMTIPPASSQPVGRITPDHFALLYADIEPGCSGFSYMGQPMRWSMAVQARALSGQRTHNYFGDFVRAPQSRQLVAEQAANGQDLAARISTTAGDFSWQFGEAVWLEQAVTFLRSSEPDGPYSQLQFGLRFQDGDSIGLNGLDMDPQSAGDCVASESCTAVQLAGLQDLRYGRLTLENAFGPEDIPLPLMLRAQYWDGQRFRLSELDQCTAFSASAASVEASAGLPSITVQGPGGLLQHGQNEAQSLWLSPPMVPGFWRWQLSTDAWLQFDWKGDGEEDPGAEAVFGRYRGNPRRIFWREPLP